MLIEDSGVSYGGICFAFLKFGLSEIPANVKIESATLRLYTVDYISQTHPVEVYVSPDNSWNEYELSWSISSVRSFDVSPIDTTYVTASGRWYEWTVTGGIVGAQSTADIVTFAVTRVHQQGSDSLSLLSRDQELSWMEPYRPQLVVSLAKT